MQQTSAAKIKSQKNKNGIFYFLYLSLLVYFVLKPFYFFESDMPQISGVKLISGVWTLKKKGRILPIKAASSQSTLKGYAMKKCTASCSCGPEGTVKDALTELLRKGARDLIAKAVEAELEALLMEYSSLCLEDGRASVVRNGYLPRRTVQTGIGEVEVRVPKV